METEGRPRLRYWLDRLVADQVLEAAVVYGYFPAYSEGNDLVVLDENGARRAGPVHLPAPAPGAAAVPGRLLRAARADGELRRGRAAAGHGRAADQRVRRRSCSPRNAYRDYLEVHGLSVQLTEALAEYWHRRVRSELVLPVGRAGGRDDPADLAGILRTDYRGCRYSFGYPACPDLEDRAKIVDLLDAERIGVELSEEFQLAPEQSTDAIVVHHPEANYFNAK